MRDDKKECEWYCWCCKSSFFTTWINFRKHIDECEVNNMKKSEDCDA